MSGEYHKGILLNICLPHNGPHFNNQGNWRGEKKDLRRGTMTSMKLDSSIPNNQDAGTINNVTFSVWGVTVFITTDQEF